MDRRTKELMDRVREAERLPPAALDRMSQSFLSRLERGDAPLAGIDASPIALSKPTLLGKLLAISGGGLKLAVIIGLGVTAGAGLWAIANLDGAPAIPSAQSTATTELHAVLQSSKARDTTQVPTPTPTLPSADSTTQPEELPRGPAHPAKGKVPHRAATASRFGSGQRATHAVSTTPEDVGAPTRDELVADGAATAKPAPIAPAQVPEPEFQEQSPEPTSPTVTHTDVDAEFALLQRAYAELSAGRTKLAFSLLDEHVRRFPHGALIESREVARMMALCSSGQITDARLRADEFLASYPKSAFRARVKTICPPATSEPRAR